MNATIKTLEVVVADKTVPVTKAIVNQLEWFDSTKYVREDCAAIGTISTPDNVFTIWSTPRGLARWTGDCSGRFGIGELPRLILLK